MPKTNSESVETEKRWRFFRAGGVDQTRIDTGADLLNLEQLDQKLWVALSCPVKGLEFDEKTLGMIDSDGDGRVRPPELLAAIKWAGSLLKNAETLVKASDSLPLAAINDATPEGKQILASAKHLLDNLGKEGATSISVKDAAETSVLFKQMKRNGDGIVPPEAIDDPVAKQVATDIIGCLGSEIDRTGLKGVTQANVDAFFAELGAYDGWWKTAEGDSKKVVPLGEATTAAYNALSAVRAKIDDYFARCRLAAFDPRALVALNRRDEEYLAVASQDFTITAQEVAGFPISRIEADKPLSLTSALNPAWAGPIAAFHAAVVIPLLGKEKSVLSEAEWTDVCARFAPYQAWNASKKGAQVEAFGLKRVREILASKAKEILTKAIADDKAVEAQVAAISNVERLARYHRDLFVLANNFVSFTDFYSQRRMAVFQAGRLYLDGRACDLCIKVNDPGKHASMAGMSKTYLAYCECTRPATNEKMTVACAFTSGDSDNLMVGRNGIFYDRKGQDWDATITRIVDNPISIRQAFFSPYKKLLRWIEEMIAKRAAAADAAANERLIAKAQATGAAAVTGQPPAPPKKLDIGIVAAIGVAVGGLAAALTGIMNSFFGLGVWMPLGIVGLMLAISGPSMLIAWMKLRQRNLGPILDANGWAVNALTRVNIPLGTSLTAKAALPPGSERSLTDPYAPKKSIWPKLILTLIVLGLIGWGLWSIDFTKGYLMQGLDWVKGLFGK